MGGPSISLSGIYIYFFTRSMVLGEFICIMVMLVSAFVMFDSLSITNMTNAC